MHGSYLYYMYMYTQRIFCGFILCECLSTHEYSEKYSLMKITNHTVRCKLHCSGNPVLMTAVL